MTNINIVPIQDQPDLVRDLGSKAILNQNRIHIDNYERQKRVLDTAKNQTEEIQQIKQDLSEIKQLLRGLLNRWLLIL